MVRRHGFLHDGQANPVLPSFCRALSGEEVLNSAKEWTESLRRQQSSEEQSCERAGNVCFMTDITSPASHQISRDDDIANGEKRCGNRKRDKEEVKAHPGQENNCGEDDACHRIASAESPIIWISTMQIVDE